MGLLPLAVPKRDAAEFIGILAGKTRQRRVPLVEYIIDDVVMKPIVQDLLGRRWIPFAEDRESRKAYLDTMVDFWYRMGYDFIRHEESLPLPDRSRWPRTGRSGAPARAGSSSCAA